MNALRIVMLGAAGLALAACNRDIGGTTTPIPELAYVRYVHAMPDTGEVDVKLVDAVENLNFANPSTGFNPYRNVSAFTGIRSGTRHFRVFTNMQSTDINVVSQVILDTTLTLAPNTYYTILHTGFARAGATPHQHFQLIQETLPTPSKTQVAVRAVVAASGVGPVDLLQAADTALASPTTLLVSNAAFGTIGGWVNVAPGSYVVRATPTGTTSPRLTQASAPAGAAAQALLDPVAGTSVGGSALTIFVFPAGVAGSPNKSLTTPSLTYAVDVRPPR